MTRLPITVYDTTKQARMPYRIRAQRNVTLEWWLGQIQSPKVIADKYSAPTYSMCKYLPRDQWCVDSEKPWSERRAANIESYSAFVLDYDSGVPIDDTVATLDDLGLAYILYTSYSHRPDHHKYRVIIPFATPVPLATYRQISKQKLTDIFPGVDPSCVDPARAFFAPAHAPAADYQISYCLTGNPIDIDVLLPDEDEVAESTPHRRSSITKIGNPLLEWYYQHLIEITPYIGSYPDRWRLAMSMRAVGFADNQIYDVVCESQERYRQFANRKWWAGRNDFGLGTINYYLRQHHPKFSNAK